MYQFRQQTTDCRQQTVGARSAVYKGIFVFLLMLLVCSTSFSQYTYQPKGKRDPFVPLVGAGGSSSVSGIKGINSKGDANLQGIIVDGAGSKSAVINGEFIKEGQTIGKFKLIKIENGSVKASIGEEKFILLLYD